ncbi:MAG: hypothetical protein ACC657_05845 [Thiohalomonadales bacterium]
MKYFTKICSISFAAAMLYTTITMAGFVSTNMVIKSAIAADSTNPSPELVKAYEKKLNTVVKEIKKNSDYKKIPLDSKKDQEWFNSQAFLLWDKKKSQKQFVDEGVARFPGYKESFEFLAVKFTN